jgi:hypothetical protein
MMTGSYLPPSEFLRAVIDEEVTFLGEFGEANLSRLIAMTANEVVANRDWAALLLAQLEIDRPDVRQALIAAADDPESCVRAEAIRGLALLDRSVALPLLQRELDGNVVCVPLLEAAETIADPSLIECLEAFSSPSDDAFLDERVTAALEACRASA